MEPLHRRLAELIAAETDAVAPPPDAKARHWAAVTAALVGDGPPDGEPPGGPPDPSGGEVVVVAAKGGGLLKLIGGVVVVGAVVAGGLATRDREPPPRVETATSSEAAATEPVVPAPAPVATTPAPVVATPESETPSADSGLTDVTGLPRALEPATAKAASDRGAPARPPSTKRGAPRDAEPTAPRGLAEELRLVEALRVAVTRGEHAKATALAAKHRREFPDGALIPDRLDLEVTARCASGDLAGGRALAQELRERWPAAPASARSKSACKDPASPTSDGPQPDPEEP